MNKGFFIAFEGGEGVGKTTQIPLIAAELRARGYEVIETREPGGTELGNEIRSILLNGTAGKMSAATEALLFTAQRAHHVERVIKPALAEGKIVITDRYAGTTYAYQGFAANGLGVEKVEELYKWAMGSFVPDLTIVFDLPREQAKGEVINPNRMESKGDDWLKSGAEGFRDMARRYPERVKILPYSWGDISAKTKEIMAIIDQSFLIPPLKSPLET